MAKRVKMPESGQRRGSYIYESEYCGCDAHTFRNHFELETSAVHAS